MLLTVDLARRRVDGEMHIDIEHRRGGAGSRGVQHDDPGLIERARIRAGRDPADVVVDFGIRQRVAVPDGLAEGACEVLTRQRGGWRSCGRRNGQHERSAGQQKQQS
jgi:hypothetical protein